MMLKYVRRKNDTIIKNTITAGEKNRRLEEARLWIQQYQRLYDENRRQKDGALPSWLVWGNMVLLVTQ